MRHAARNDTHCAVPRSTGRALALAAVLLVAARAGAQGTTGANLHLDVRPSVSAVRGDTVRVSYVVTNRVESTDSLFGFTVDVPAHAIRIEVPEPEELRETGSSWRGRPVASWGMLVRHLPPGQSSPALTYEAVGVLGALLHELDAQRGKHVSDAAYTLLRANAEYLLRRL